MALAVGRGRPLGEPQMEPTVSYLADACDPSYIRIRRVLSIATLKALSAIGRGEQPTSSSVTLV